jgi:hypothetical protein
MRPGVGHRYSSAVSPAYIYPFAGHGFALHRDKATLRFNNYKTTINSHSATVSGDGEARALSVGL